MSFVFARVFVAMFLSMAFDNVLLFICRKRCTVAKFSELFHNCSAVGRFVFVGIRSDVLSANFSSMVSQVACCLPTFRPNCKTAGLSTTCFVLEISLFYVVDNLGAQSIRKSKISSTSEQRAVHNTAFLALRSKKSPTAQHFWYLGGKSSC